MNRRRERDTTEAETSSAAASRHHSQLQTSLNIAKQNLQSKKDEMSRKPPLPNSSSSLHTGLEKLIADALQESDRTTIEEAIEEAEEELEVRQRWVRYYSGKVLMM